MNVTQQWWKANHIYCGRNYEELVEIKAKYLTHVASVQVLPPPRRRDLQCHIHGEISFNVAGDTRDSVTLYSRDRDNSELIDLSDDGPGSYLTLSDHHESERPLPKVTSSKPLLFKIKLYEAKEGKDMLIADVHGDSKCGAGEAQYFRIEGELGFRFEISYSVLLGARVEIGVKITDREGPHSISMWGLIGAHQYLEELDHEPNGETITYMRVIDKTDPVTFSVGDCIELERRFVVAPMVYDTYLCVCIAPLVDDDVRVVYHDVNFPLTPDPGVVRLNRASFWTNKEMTHTKDVHHNGTVFSVSITFVPPE